MFLDLCYKVEKKRERMKQSWNCEFDLLDQNDNAEFMEYTRLNRAPHKCVIYLVKFVFMEGVKFIICYRCDVSKAEIRTTSENHVCSFKHFLISRSCNFFFVFGFSNSHSINLVSCFIFLLFL